MLNRKNSVSKEEKGLKKELEKELESIYDFSTERILNIFELWKDDLKWLKDEIKQFQEFENDYSYTELGKSIWSLLYDILINKK